MSRPAAELRTPLPSLLASESEQVLDWLVTAVRSGLDPRFLPPPPTAVGEPPRGLAEAAERHGVEGQLLRYAMRQGLEVPGLRSRLHSALARHQRSLVELQLAQDALASAGVQLLVVKGPALACGAYPSVELRSYVDLDLLVAPAAVGSAVRALESRGFRLLDANWPLIRSQALRELRLAGPYGGAVDLHWSLSSPTGSTPPSVPELLAAARVLITDDVQLRTLSWADTVVHVATHAADSGGHRLVWLADLYVLLESLGQEGVDLLVRTAKSWGALPALHLMLTRLERVLGLQLPPGLTDATRPKGVWASVTALADAVAPFDRASDGGSLGRLLARSSRETSARSCAAVLAKSSLWLIHRGAAPPSAASINDPGNPKSALHPSGGPEARESFFAMLEETSERLAMSAGLSH